MAIAVDPRKKHPYVLEEERELPTTEQTVFLIRALTTWEILDAPDDEAQFVKYVAPLGIVGWNNFKDDEGKELPFETDNVPLIRPKDIGEIVLAINNLSVVTKDEAKN